MNIFDDKNKINNNVNNDNNNNNNVLILNVIVPKT